MVKQQSAIRDLQALCFLALLLLCSAVAAPQMATRKLSGTVTDHQHEPLNGAVVQVENGVTLGVVSYVTTRDGKYTFKRLDAHTDYRMWVKFRGRQSRVRQMSQFDSNRPKTINFVLNLP